MFALLIIVIIAIIVGQAVIFGRLKAKINAFKEVFKHPYDKAEFNTITYDSKANGIFKVIVTCINSYIQNNGNRANDYHLMQDIVERNCDSKEEEIQSQIPTTLYLGLIGTMLGIIIGISELFSGGGLSELLAGTVQTNAIENMLKGVAVAMLASAAGITLTTILTFIFKSAKAKNADDKNLFLSWIQANLLPAMSSDVNTALDKMSEALSKFNDQFADNTQKLNSTLSLVAKTSEDQALLYDAISNLEIGEMAKANVKVYKALKDSAEQIDHLADVLRASRDYVDEVRTLNENLDKSERRTKMFEEMGDFFRTEINAIETRKQMILNSIEESNEKFNGEFNKFVGKYEDKDAMFIVSNDYYNDSTTTLRIYEINSQLEQAIGYNIYRANSEDQIVKLAEVLESNTFTDPSWGELATGLYRYGISEVDSNGNESEILWSNTIVSTFDGIEENNIDHEDSTDPSVQKVIEDGQIVIIKDGKRYSVSGQRLKCKNTNKQ